MRQQQVIHCEGIRSGLTLLELMVSMLASTALVAGLSSTLFVATQIVDPPSRPDRVTAQASLEVDRLLQDLRYATLIHEMDDRTVDIDVADRDSDGLSERIRIVWSGVAGDPITRSINGDSAVPLVQNVFEMQMTSQATDSGEIVSLGMRLQIGPSSTGLVQSRIDLPNRPYVSGE